MRAAIPVCIALLLFVAVLRLFPTTVPLLRSQSKKDLVFSLWLVLLAQLLMPLLVLIIGRALSAPTVGLLAATLVTAAPPISGSLNLVVLLRGEGSAAMRWLMLGTALLPLTSLPILYLLHPSQSVTIMFEPAISLLLLIGGSVAAAVLFLKLVAAREWVLSSEALDGISAVVLAVMVIGLMSAVHHPDNSWAAIAEMMLLAVIINVGLQVLGAWLSNLFKCVSSLVITHGVILGNRNIALFLTALPATQIEPLLLFVACYQVPMYLTPLLGNYFYRRLE